MSFSSAELFAAAGGGALGAALGALLAFSLMGAVVVVTTLGAVAAGTPGSTTLVTDVAFGPVLGPHITFAAGVAAAAYATHRKLHPSGREIATPLISLGHPSILLVGAACGVAGQILARIVAELTTVTTDRVGTISMTDSLATSVVLTALISVVFWGRSTEGARPEPQVWLPWQHEPAQVLVISAMAGCTAGAALLLWPAEGRPMVGLFLYGLSALSLIALVFGKAVPVTHHLTLPAALGASLALAHGAADIVVILAAVATSLFSGLVAEAWARGFLERSRVHLDPPALAIAVAASALAAVQFAVG